MHRSIGPGLVIGSILALAACAAPPEEAPDDLARLEEQLSGVAAALEKTGAELQEFIPPAGPRQAAEGEPRPAAEGFDEVALREESDPDCPGSKWAKVRAEAGSNCATYQAEISAWYERCVPRCDGADIARLTVRLAAARCSEWCSSKGCGVASFVPPPQGCTSGNCYPSPDCPDEACPLMEYCGLLRTNLVWNCFCRDIIPT